MLLWKRLFSIPFKEENLAAFVDYSKEFPDSCICASVTFTFDNIVVKDGVYFLFYCQQAECEELQERVDKLNNENCTLRDELQRLSAECEKLTSENNYIKV